MNKLILKLIFLILYLVVGTSSIYANNVNLRKDEIKKAYELGAFHTVGQMNRNIKIQGWEEESIKFEKYMVTLQLDKQPTYRILAYLRYGYTEGVTPVITTSKQIVFGSYENEADALYLKELLNKTYFKYEINQCKITNNLQNKIYKKAPFLYKNMYFLMKKELKEKLDAQVYVVDKNEDLQKKYEKLKIDYKNQVLAYDKLEKKYKKLSKKNKQNIKKDELIRYFKIKEKYEKIEKLKSLEGFPGYKHKFDPDKFISAGFYDQKNKKYKFKKFIYTTTGDKFIKVYNKVIYVDANDVEIIE